MYLLRLLGGGLLLAVGLGSFFLGTVHLTAKIAESIQSHDLHLLIVPFVIATCSFACGIAGTWLVLRGSKPKV
jgi:hypothetical protein